jgi:hypothetical protein
MEELGYPVTDCNGKSQIGKSLHVIEHRESDRLYENLQVYDYIYTIASQDND